MTTAIVATSAGAIATADNDQMLIDLFIATKRSPNTRVQYAHSIGMLLGATGKPLGAITLQDAVSYHDWLKAQYSAGSVRLHVNVAKALCAFGVKLNYLRTNVFAVIKPDSVPEITHKRILTEEETLKLIDAPARSRDKLLLRLIYAAGLRVGEVCVLVWGDLLPNGVLHIRQGLLPICTSPARPAPRNVAILRCAATDAQRTSAGYMPACRMHKHGASAGPEIL